MATLGNVPSTQTLLGTINFDELAASNAPGTTYTGLATGSFTSGASNTTLAAVSGLTLTLAAGTYLVEGYISCSAAATPGIKVAIVAGTATISTLLTDTWGYNTTTLSGEVNATSAGTIYGVAAAATVLEIGGVIVLTAPGTVIFQAAQQVSNATPTTIANNSYLCYTRVV